VAEERDWKTIRVAAVTAGSPAAKAGLVAEDLLQTVNGKVVPPPLDELQKLLAQPGASIVVTILRSGKQNTM
jgi:serine protease Do